MIRRILPFAVLVAAVGLGACDKKLTIVNPTAGDTKRVLGTPTDAEALISSYYKRWHTGVYGSTTDLEGMANIFALANYSSLANNCMNSHAPFSGAQNANAPGNVCGGEQSSPGVVGVVLTVDQAGGGDDVDATRQDTFEFGDIGPMRHVDNAIRAECQDRLSIVGRGDSHWVASGQRAGVLAAFVGAVTVQADEFQSRIVENGAYCADSDDAAGPLCDPDRSCALRHPTPRSVGRANASVFPL